MKPKLKFVQSKNIKLYKPILEKLTDEWEYEHYPYILTWCNSINNEEKFKDFYWQNWLVKHKKEVVGICGLYSLNENTNELWLGWLGFIPEYRNQGLGEQLIKFLEKEAKTSSCSNIISYVENEKSLHFYFKNGFKLIGTVEEYIKVHPELKDEFEEKYYNWWIIRKEI